MTPDEALAKLRATLGRHSHGFDLDRDDLGRRLCKAATDGVQYSIAREETPDGQRWADLSEKYEEWKSFNYPGNPMAVLHGTMADPREVAGEVDPPSATRAIVTYGVSEQAREEAAWFQEGGGKPGHGQPARPFWGFTEESRKEVKSILDARFKQIK